MKSSTLLDSIVFQLTPTRTRCDLVITANEKSEKLASGLLNPFLAHLKAAEDQIGKGGYSIILEPKSQSDAAWFTKGTVERFVRFVSSPEILERVCTIESEILQIQKAISLQKSNDNGLHKVEDCPVKSEERLEGSKPAPVCNDEKAIVLYQPNPESEEDASIIQAKDSKVQLVQVLEARKSVLQKEQGMAFARAIAASFDIDNIATLLAFAECFGASRMMDACKNFLDLWKAKHESGQWVEIEATEAMSCRSDLPSTNATGIVFLSPNESHQGEIASEKSGTDQVPPIPQEYSPGQFPHPMFPPWQMHPPANGMTVFQPYPMQGMPYYQNYMGQSPFFQSPYTPRDDSKLHSGRKTRQRRHSMDSRDLSVELESQELDGSATDDVTDEEDSSSKKPKNKGTKSSRKQPGTVVIRNINYITSKKQNSSVGDPQSSSESGTDNEGRTLKAGETKKSKKKGAYSNSNEERMSGQAGDDGNWQAFQSFLLNDAEENNNSMESNMFAMEGKAHGRKRQSAIGDDSSALGMRKIGEHDVGMGKNLDISGDATRMRKSTGDQMLSYGQDSNLRYRDGKKDLLFMEVGGQRGVYRRSMDTNMEYMINHRENLTDMWDASLDPVIRNGFQGRISDNNHKGSSIDMSDESFVVLQRSGLLDQVRGGRRTAMDMDCELPLASCTDDHTFEPNDLNLMPNRVMEDQASVYDPAMEYEMQAQNNNATKLNGKKEVAMEAKAGLRKAVKDQKLKAEKRTTVSSRRPSKLTPAEDACARAERLRAYKADLQKLKKEKEEEQRKRLEALKRERQKRIASKSGANTSPSPLRSQQVKRQVPKLSPVSQKGSKFSDTEPGSSSPLQRSKLRLISNASPDTSKVSKSGGLKNASKTNENRLTRSASSLRIRKEDKNGPTPDTKAAMSRIRRLSEPKGTVRQNSLGKSRSAEAVSRNRVSEKTQIKKISATSNVDKLKSSRLLEVKVRASKASEVTVQRKSTREMSQKSNGDILPSGQASRKRDSANISPAKYVDDTTVVEKTVVMLEFEKPSASVHDPEEKIGIQTMHSPVHDHASNTVEDRTGPPPASPIIVKEVDQEKSNCIVKGETQNHLGETGKMLSTLPSADTHKKTYQAPYARISSEDSCMTDSDYGKAPTTNIEMEALGVQATKIHVPNTQRPGLNNINNVSEAESGKSQGKESSKGFKRLLIFGKKNSATSERGSIESEKATLNGSMVDDHALNGSSSEDFTLKNLLTQEESSSAVSTLKKSSRPFSLLSHFRSKNSEKLAS